MRSSPHDTGVCAAAGVTVALGRCGGATAKSCCTYATSGSPASFNASASLILVAKPVAQAENTVPECALASVRARETAPCLRTEAVSASLTRYLPGMAARDPAPRMTGVGNGSLNAGGAELNSSAAVASTPIAVRPHRLALNMLT